jgi:hypothetical protein
MARYHLGRTDWHHLVSHYVVASLKPILAFDKPFSRVLVDCVGPLPKAKTGGNQFLLTIMCAATCFPEAIPLRKIPVSLRPW